MYHKAYFKPYITNRQENEAVYMQQAQRQKKKKKQQQITLALEELISEAGLNLVDFLKEQENDKKYLDVPVCPKCKSPKIKRVNTLEDPTSHMGLTPPKYECADCGHSTRIELKATNRPYSVKEVELILEAIEATQTGATTQSSHKKASSPY